MKTCFKCKKNKPLNDFYKHKGMIDGYLGKCKVCTKLDVSKHRAENLEKVREYDRQRSKNPIRIKLNKEITKAWRAEDERRAKAHQTVAYAIKKGEIVKQSCFRCSKESAIAHHEDYDKPLEIIWLCQPCHKQRHKEINEILRSNK